ncbi:MAG: alpha/beta hydrolase [Bdellovibrionota bacterium]
MFGFGSTNKIANGVESWGIGPWRQSLKLAVSEVAKCFSSVTVIGFSLGGGLVAEYILSKDLDSKVESAVLLAPYLGTVENSFLAPIVSALGDTIDLDVVAKLASKEDIKVLESHPEAYNDAIPAKAANQVVNFGKTLDNMKSSEKTDLPVKVIYSEADKTVNLSKIDSFSRAHFNNLSIESIEKQHKIPHQLLIKHPGKEQIYDDFVEDVKSFIGKH